MRLSRILATTALIAAAPSAALATNGYFSHGTVPRTPVWLAQEPRCPRTALPQPPTRQAWRLWAVAWTAGWRCFLRAGVMAWKVALCRHLMELSILRRELYKAKTMLS